MQFILQVRQLQQLLLPSAVQRLMELLVDRINFPPDFPALRFLAEPLVQGHHVILHAYRLLFSDTQYPNLGKIARVKERNYQTVKNSSGGSFLGLLSLISDARIVWEKAPISQRR